MSIIKIIEGTAVEIEEAAERMEFYELDSLQYLYRTCVVRDDGTCTVDEVTFYVAVFKLSNEVS